MVRYVGPIAVEIHDEVLFLPGGSVRRWASDIARENTVNTKAAAPLNKRTRKFAGAPPIGTLKRLISSTVDQVGPRQLDIVTESKAPYSIYVIKGTRTQYKRDPLGRFGSAYPGGFPLPTNNFGKFKRVQRIRGQEANNFLADGYDRTAARHQALRRGAIRD